MEVNENKKAAFLIVKSFCNSLIQNPGKDHPEQLKQVLNFVGDTVIEEFVDYILYPIKLQIFNKDLAKRDDTVCILLDCLYQILQHLRLTTEGLFMEIYSIICFSLVQGQPESKTKEPSEELKVNVLRNAKLLFSQADDQLLDSLFKKKEFYSKLCVLIYNALQFASKEKSITLRCLALECLLGLCRLNNVTISEIGNVNLDSAKVVKKCIPGLITECRSIVSEGPTQNHQITVLVLKLWSRSVSLVLADFHNMNSQSSIQELVGNFSAKNELAKTDKLFKNDRDILKSEDFTEDWIKAASARLTSATNVFTLLKLHPHFKVRKQLVSSVTLILAYAPVNMSPSLGCLLDALIVLTEDSDESVAKASLQALEHFKKGWNKNRGRHLVEDVKDCFCSLLNRLPRILHGSDEKLKESDMTLLCGYILLLGQDNFADFITSQQLLDKLINCLLEAASLDCSNVSLMEESSVRDLNDKSYGVIPWRIFSICNTTKLNIQLDKVFQILSSAPNLIDIAFALLEIFNNSPFKRLEATLCINSVLLSSQQVVDKKYSHLVKTIVNEYLKPYFWNNRHQQMLSESTNSKKSIVQACLCMEGVGKLAKTIGPDNFSPFLFKCIFPLLEYAGSPYSYIAQAGLVSLNKIGSVYNGGITNLIQNNVDYLSHHISVNLRHVDRQVTVLYVLTAVMKYSTLNTLPSLLEIINNVLLQSFDKYQRKNLNCYLHVFKTFLNSLQLWMHETNDKTSGEADKSLIEMLLAYQEMKKISVNFEDTEELNANEEINQNDKPMRDEEDDFEEKKKNIPNYIKLTEAIMLRSAHFLPSKDTVQQNDTMQILDKGSLILVKYPDVLLPVVHKIWSPLVERFDPSCDPLTIKNAFSLLLTLAYTSKEFIRQRSLKQVIPKICLMLKKLSIESRLKPQLHGYRFSQKYKLQLSILEGLGDLAVNIDLAGKEIFELLISCQVYLSTTQPKPLQDACVDVFIKLSKLNRGMVWLHLMSLWPEEEYLSTTDDCQRKYEIHINQENEHLKKNVVHLLSLLAS